MESGSFSNEISSAITRVPLCPTLPPDRFIWRHTESGVFTVRSAYHFDRSVKGINCFSDSRSFWNWNYLWNTPTTPRSKLFIWRLCNRALPLKSYLRKRGVVIEECCNICKHAVEDGTHVFRDCKLPSEVWNLLPFGKLLFGPSLADPLSWIKYVAWVLNPMEWCWFVFCLWDLWNQRTAFFS